MRLMIRESSFMEDDWSIEIGNYVISMSWNSNYRGGSYSVEVCEKQSDGLCGYPLYKNTYATEEQAKRMYKKRIKQAERGEI